MAAPCHLPTIVTPKFVSRNSIEISQTHTKHTHRKCTQVTYITQPITFICCLSVQFCPINNDNGRFPIISSTLLETSIITSNHYFFSPYTNLSPQLSLLPLSLKSFHFIYPSISITFSSSPLVSSLLFSLLFFSSLPT